MRSVGRQSLLREVRRWHLQTFFLSANKVIERDLEELLFTGHTRTPNFSKSKNPDKRNPTASTILGDWGPW